MHLPLWDHVNLIAEFAAKRKSVNAWCRLALCVAYVGLSFRFECLTFILIQFHWILEIMCTNPCTYSEGIPSVAASHGIRCPVTHRLLPSSTNIQRSADNYQSTTKKYFTIPSRRYTRLKTKKRKSVENCQTSNSLFLFTHLYLPIDRSILFLSILWKRTKEKSLQLPTPCKWFALFVCCSVLLCASNELNMLSQLTVASISMANASDFGFSMCVTRLSHPWLRNQMKQFKIALYLADCQLQ